MLSPRRKAFFALVCGAVIAIWAGYRLAMPGARFLLSFMDASEQARRADATLVVEPVSIYGPDRRIRARVYKPQEGFDKVLLVVHGVHSGGYDEPRLVHFSKRLARLGHAVVTPELDDLKSYEITAQAVRDIARSALWLLDESGLLKTGRDQRIGLLGISFAGGLCLSAASLPELNGRIRFVFSFGGHADLDETTAYLATGDLPGGRHLKPHVYGQAVLIRELAPKLVEPSEVEPLRRVLLDYLQDKTDDVNRNLDRLGSASRRLVELCLQREAGEIGKILEPLVRLHRWPKILSPARARPPSCPVFLLHGSADNVIPPSQTAALQAWAARSTKTTALVSDLIKHVELEEKSDPKGSVLDYWKIIRFWTELLRS